MLVGIDARPAFVNEMERQLRLNEDILRFLTLGVEAIDEGKSAILSRDTSERDRNFRGPKPFAKFESGRRRNFGDREEFRAREATGNELAEESAPDSELSAIG